MRLFYCLSWIFSFLLLSCRPDITAVRMVNDISESDSTVDLHDKKYIKVHTKSGQLAVLSEWSFDRENELITGYGKLYNKHRKQINDRNSQLKINFENCTVVETNDLFGQNLVSPIFMSLSTVYTGVTLPCLFDPKSCFGSCPTFYLKEGQDWVIKAEGFSSSISKSMEKEDIDFILEDYSSDVGFLDIQLTNEAMETHYIRYANLLVVEKGEESSKTFNHDGRFYQTNKIVKPISIQNKTKEELKKISLQDGVEYSSLSDSIDLLTKETLIFEFDNYLDENSGIILTHRQSFLTTYLFYQSLAYMGRSYGDLMATYENADPKIRSKVKSIYNILGGIEVSIFDGKKWKDIGTIQETGPIVSDTHILPISIEGKFNKVRLKMTKGLWRIDQVSGCQNLTEVYPREVKPTALVENGQLNNHELNLLIDEEQMLINQPGAVYTLRYEDQFLSAKNVDIFLKTSGYYTEWMRKEWLDEENPEMVMMMLKQPKTWLKTMAPKFKEVEPIMDSLFWASKFNDLEN